MLNRSNVVLTVCAVALLAGAASAAPKAKPQSEGGVAGAGIPALTTTRVASGLSFPLYATSPKSDSTRLFIVEKPGRIRILNLTSGVLFAGSFLDIDAATGGGTSLNNEQGLLGLAFHPNYASNGFFYVYHTTAAGSAQVVERYSVTANPNVADPLSASLILNMIDFASNHNGGWIGFGPDGYLYITTGDGGSQFDSGTGHDPVLGNGQSLSTPLGKILRIDVDGADNIPGNDDDDGILGNGSTGGYTSPPDNPFFGATAGLDEIWAYGMRNPYRASFDRGTGAFYIGDVGQGSIEEIDYQAPNAAGSTVGQPGYQGGRNYGWKCKEGNTCTGLGGCNCADPSLVNPIHEYNHGVGVAIIGGYVYRGCAIPALQGTYFFADFASSQIFSFSYDGTSMTNFANRTAELAPGGGLSITGISGFGEDVRGEMYICDHGGGEIFKIIPVTPLPTGDLNADGFTNGLDIGFVLGAWSIPTGVPGCSAAVPCCSDLNNDGVVDGLDIGILLSAWTG